MRRSPEGPEVKRAAVSRPPPRVSNGDAPPSDDEALLETLDDEPLEEPAGPRVIHLEEEDGGAVVSAQVELLPALEGFDVNEAIRCDFHDHKAELLSELLANARRPAVLAQWTTDATGAFQVGDGERLEAGWLRVVRRDGSEAIEPVPYGDSLTLSARLEGSTTLLDSDGGVIAFASVYEFEPGTNVMHRSKTDALGGWRWQSASGGLFFIEAPGFLNFSEQSRSEVIRISRPCTIEVRAPWAKDGTVVTLPRMHSREAVFQGGVARFERVKRGDFRVEVDSPEAVTSATGTVDEGATAVVVLEHRRPATVSFIVTDRAGGPLSGVAVRAHGVAHRMTDLVLASEPGARIELVGLAEGPFEYEISAEGYRTARGTGTLRPGENVVEVQLGQVLRVEGVVVARNGLSLDGFRVTAPGASDVTVHGTFSLEIDPAETVELTVSREGRELITRKLALPIAERVTVVLPWDGVRLYVGTIDGNPKRLALRSATSTIACRFILGRCSFLLEAEVQPDVPYSITADEGTLFDPATLTFSAAEPTVALKIANRGSSR
ncbi:MAG: hypothetical protein SFW67_15350 [Myxococcaceae bacterium]|nr:hypothetical protein [Myxococcaceae bacterium]